MPRDHAKSLPDARRPDISQHFFRDPNLAARVITSLPLRRDAPVVEVGPGTGRLTDALAGAGFRVIAIEKDVRLFRALRARLIGRTNVELHHGDALRFPLPLGTYSVVANVPFSITSALLRRLLDAPAPSLDAFLIVQREAAARFTGKPDETLFSLLHKPRFTFEVLREFRRIDFDPPPRVRPVLLQVHRRATPLLDAAAARRYERFVAVTFGADREAGRALRAHFTKLQVRRLASDLAFSRQARPSELTFAQWLALFRFYEHVAMGRDPTPVESAATAPRFPLPRRLPTMSPPTAKEHAYGPRTAAARR